MNQLPFPTLTCCKQGIKLFTGLWKARLEQVVTDLPDGLLRCPSIESFRSLVPGEDLVCRVAHQDGIIGIFNELSLDLSPLFVLLRFLNMLFALGSISK